MDEALARCTGFAVHTSRGPVGRVDQVCMHPQTGRPRALAVAGRGRWRVLVPVEEVEEIRVRERRLVLRTGGLVSRPSPAAEGTRSG